MIQLAVRSWGVGKITPTADCYHNAWTSLKSYLKHYLHQFWVCSSPFQTSEHDTQWSNHQEKYMHVYYLPW